MIHDERGPGRTPGHRTRPPGRAARAALAEVAALTGHPPDAVVSLEHDGDGWNVGVEIVETRRIPDTADIIAVYEVRLDESGELRSYRRVRRYARGQIDRSCR